MKESTKIRLFAIVAALILGMFGCVFGQDVKARSFRDEGENKYDHAKYFNLALLIYSDDKLDKTDSITVFIHERDSTNASLFTVCEKTDLYFAYGKMYDVFVTRNGYSKVHFNVNSGVKVKEYGMFIPIYLEKKEANVHAGIVVWDTRINDVHYYPEKVYYK